MTIGSFVASSFGDSVLRVETVIFLKIVCIACLPHAPKSKSPLPSHTKSHLPIYSYSFDFLLLQCGFGRSVAPIKAGSVGCVGRRNTRK